MNPIKIHIDNIRLDQAHPHTEAMSLAEDWPWWSVQEYSLVKDEIQSDPRWKEWVSKLQQSSSPRPARSFLFAFCGAIFVIWFSL